MKETEPKECGNFKIKWLNEAIETLKHYTNDPFTTNFLVKHNLPPQPTCKKMYQLIEKKINDPDSSLRFEDLVEYLDELKMWGKQHVFLYKIDSEEDLLNLSTAGYLEEQLRSLNLENRYNNNICKWEAEKPFLAEVKYQGKEEPLIIKWVETRWYGQINHHSERAVNFLIINLKNGICQLRIQTLNHYPLKKLSGEVVVYEKIIKELFKFHHFSPISLELVMKQFLIKSILPIICWKIYEKGGRLRGYKIKPSFVERNFKIPFKSCIPYEIEVKWKCHQECKDIDGIFFTIKSKNQVKFNSITDKSKVDFILDILLKEYFKIRIGGGKLDELLKEIDPNDPHKNLKKIAVQAKIVRPFFVVRVISALLKWMVQGTFEDMTRVPFIVIEMLAYLFVSLNFYGENRIIKFLVKIGIPEKFIIYIITYILGKWTRKLFTDKKYIEWEKETMNAY